MMRSPRLFGFRLPIPAALLALCAALPSARLRAGTPNPGPGTRHITVPFKMLKTGAWAADGLSYTMDIEDAALGRVTLRMRIARVNEHGYTFAADGTDYEVTWPLPPEAQAGGVLAFKRRQLGEPLNAATGERFVRFCLAASYFRNAERYLQRLDVLPESKRKELRARLLEERTKAALGTARELLRFGQFERAGRVLADALASLSAPDAAALPARSAAAQRIQRLEKDARQLQVALSAEARARQAWREKINLVRRALEGARGQDAERIRLLSLDLDGPLPASRRTEILKTVHLAGRRTINYTQALEALQEISFAVRYGPAVPRSEVPSLQDFFAAEAALNAYFDARDGEAAAKLEKALAFRGLTDRVFEALVRRGRRVSPPPARHPEASPQGPFRLKAPVGELEVALDYRVMLPLDYHPSRPRPLLIALHGMNSKAQAALQLWAPEALKRGWIVAAPELVIGRGKGYLSTLEEREMALRTLSDCARNFAVDPSRVYLAGHSMGGHMAWDVALTYPGRFAGAAPFIGCVNGVSANYLLNLALTPVYCVDGAKDGAITRVNRLVHEEARKKKLPLVYKEIPGRGHEAFLGEIPGACAWLEKQRRARAPRQVDFVSADTETSRAHWLEMRSRTPQKRPTRKDPLANLKTAIRSGGLARLSGQVRPGNRVLLKAFHVRAARIYVCRELFDPRQPLRVTVNGRPERTLKTKPSRRRLLRIARQSGDRERLYWDWVDVAVPR